jgi:transcriptional regulator
MYLPKHFSSPSNQAAELLIRQYPLAQLITLDGQGQLVCNPIPLLVRDQLVAGSVLIGHVARANPLWQQEGPVLAVFTGPQAYITPNAYPSKAEHHRVVPTYNYATVQVRGQLVAHDAVAAKLEAVGELTDFAEQSQPRPWAVSDAPDDFVQANLRAIVAIEIRIESVTAKFKLSQNRSAADQAGVRDYLAGQVTDADAAAMLKLMQKYDNDQ